MIRITETVKQLIIINALFFVGSMALNQFLMGVNIDTFRLFGRLGLAIFYFSSDYFQPFQVFTHMFMHADLGHLFFNMFGLYMFGSLLEQRLGAKNFLMLYFVSGAGALILQMLSYYIEINYMGGAYLINRPMLGASGALMGVYAATAFFFPNLQVFLLFPPIPLKMKYLVIGFVALDLFSGLSSTGTGIAHFAHVGGAVAGFLLALNWKRNRYV
jgi:membrane associated rhomboid family serine protease